MKVNINGTEYIYPTSLEQITLGQRIDFYNAYEKGRVIPEDELDAIEERLSFAVKQFAFYTGASESEIKAHVSIKEMLDVIQSSATIMKEQELTMQVESEYLFKGELWCIAAPETNATSTHTFNEFLSSKEIVRQMQQLGEGDFATLQYLCAIYLRKQGEPFSETFVSGERFALMRELPLSIALAVAFFLSSSMNTFQSTLLSLKPEQEAAGLT